MDQQEDGITRAPWTSDQVASLNAYQTGGAFHEFTCGDGACRARDSLKQGPLVAYPDGWHCQRCEYTQDWAHAWMADGSWRQLSPVHAAAFMSTAQGAVISGNDSQP